MKQIEIKDTDKEECPNDYLEIYEQTTESGEIVEGEYNILLHNNDTWNTLYANTESLTGLRDGINELLGETQ